MKKMSEVFNLPLTQEFGVVTESNGNWCARFNLPNEAYHAAHAINRADALADALAYALDVLAHCKADAGYSSRQTKAAIAGDEALKAYRGEK